MNEVGAKEKVESQYNETSVVKIDIHVGVFFDGTNNNANTNNWLDWLKFSSIVEKNHAYNNTIKFSEAQKEGKEDKDESSIKYRKNSNPAILSKLFYTKSINHASNDNSKFLHVYIEGAGANGFQAESKIVDFMINGKAIKGLGFGVGSTGVVAKVSKAVKYVADRIKSEEKNNFTEISYIHFYIFGFSRGSACARLFSYLVARSAGDNVGTLKKNDDGLIKKNAEEEFDNYLSWKYFKNKKVSFLENYKGKMSVDFLGIYDTVAAIGFLKEENGNVNGLRTLFMSDSEFWDNFHKENVECYGLYSPNLSNVKSTCHICALDEFRANFALTDIGKAVNRDSNIELLLPGCHSDIGGGYIDTDKTEKKTLKAIHSGKITRMCVNCPTNSAIDEKSKDSKYWKELSAETLNELGWNDNGFTTENESFELNHYPKPRNPYSNIPLKFMYKRALSKAPYLENLFDKYPEFYYPIPKDKDNKYLAEMWEYLESRIIDKNGRICYLIGDKYNSEAYRQMRQKYLHFTSTDTLHGPGDLGNPPGRRIEGSYSDICRYIYHGDKEDNKNFYYMQDYAIDV